MASSTVVSSVEAFEFDLTSSSCEISRLLMSAIDCVDYDRMVAVDFIRKASLLLKAMAGRERGASKQGGLAPWQIKRVEQMIDIRDDFSGRAGPDDQAEHELFFNRLQGQLRNVPS
ncbi:hypothetical protein [Neorhizobium alkalisoli]|uniref:Uncharacterized protein n=1 Tax=Neorhizobium alkalisoli TaxID=528178 RepID=A0A561Q0M7_9HYPH|nr:hypothetical protein [Neorhizobium alkalisoli]TWF43938.1 hypothetical protein FHW37_11726 [Neorhizobium alkalisoli]